MLQESTYFLRIKRGNELHFLSERTPHTYVLKLDTTVIIIFSYKILYFGGRHMSDPKTDTVFEIRFNKISSWCKSHMLIRLPHDILPRYKLLHQTDVITKCYRIPPLERSVFLR